MVAEQCFVALFIIVTSYILDLGELIVKALWLVVAALYRQLLHNLKGLPLTIESV